MKQIEKPLQKHGGRLEHNETYCGSCFGAEAVCFSVALCIDVLLNVYYRVYKNVLKGLWIVNVDIFSRFS